MFIVRNCTRIRKLALRMINELVEKNEVYNAEKIDGKWHRGFASTTTAGGRGNEHSRRAAHCPFLPLSGIWIR